MKIINKVKDFVYGCVYSEYVDILKNILNKIISNNNLLESFRTEDYSFFDYIWVKRNELAEALSNTIKYDKIRIEAKERFKNYDFEKVLISNVYFFICEVLQKDIKLFKKIYDNELEKIKLYYCAENNVVMNYLSDIVKLYSPIIEFIIRECDKKFYDKYFFNKNIISDLIIISIFWKSFSPKMD